MMTVLTVFQGISDTVLEMFYTLPLMRGFCRSRRLSKCHEKPAVRAKLYSGVNH